MKGGESLKIFDVDITKKYIFFTFDGKKYNVSFYDSIVKGIYDVKVFVDGNENETKITGTYPPIKHVLKELRQIIIPAWFRKLLQLHSRSFE